MSFPLGSTCGWTLVHKRRPPPACGSEKPFRPHLLTPSPPLTCRVQAVSQGVMLLGGGDGEQGGKLKGTESLAVWAPLAHSEPGPKAGEQPKALGRRILAAEGRFWLLVLAAATDPAESKGALPGVKEELLESRD